MTAQQLGGLSLVECISGTAMDGPTEFRGFVTVRALRTDGSSLVGQLPPDQVRSLALQFLEAAEAADQDAMVFTQLVGEMGLDPNRAAAFVSRQRELRDGRRQDGI